VVFTAPVVITKAASDINASGAVLNGNLASLGTAPHVSVSFEYGLNTGYGSSAAGVPPALADPGAFTAGLTDLRPSTLYHFRTRAVGDGIAYGADQTFTTLPLPTTPAVTKAPVVTTKAASDINSSGAVLNGNLVSLGTASHVNVSFEYGLTTDYSSTATGVPPTLAGPGSFTVDVTGLTPNTLYHFRAKAEGDGTAYGDDDTFTTQEETPPGVVAFPLINGTPGLVYDNKKSAYQSPGGGGTAYTNHESYAQMLARDSYIWSGAYVLVISNSRKAPTSLRSRINGDYGNQQVTIPAGESGVFRDIINTDVLSDGDLFDWEISSSGGESIVINAIGSVMESPNGSTILCASRVNAGADLHQGQIQYLTVLGMLAVTESNDTSPDRENRSKYRIETATTLSHFRLVVGSNNIDADTTYTVRKNGVNTALTITVPAKATGAFEDTTHAVAFAPGDYLSYQAVSGSSGGADTRIYNCLIQVKSSSTSRQVGFGLVTPHSHQSPGTVCYYPIEGGNRTEPPGEQNEADVQVAAQVDNTIKNLGVSVYSNTLNGKATFTLRVNGRDTDLAVIVPPGQIGFYQNLKEKIHVSPSDMIDWKVKTGGTSGSIEVCALGGEFGPP
jgi:hypothetical protein